MGPMRTSPTPSAARSLRPAGGFVFWMLILMGLSTFAPCVLLPEWRAYQAIRTTEQMELHRLRAMQRVVEHERRLLEAMQSDPAVIARLAQRDLGFHRPSDTLVTLQVPRTAEPAEEPFTPEPIYPPAVLARMGSFLPRLDYDALFCDRRTRLVLMVMSVALIVVALGLFNGRSAIKEHRCGEPFKPV